MSKPLNRIIFIIFFAITICELSYVFISNQVKKVDFHTNQKLNEIFLDTTNYDVLFIGSSKTHADINPKVIDSICGMNSYNAGLDGISLFEFKMIFDAYLEKHPLPKCVIISFDLHSFTGSTNFFNYVQYFPYLKNKVVDTTINNNGHATTRIKWLPFLDVTDYSDDQKIIYPVKNWKRLNDIPNGDFQYKGYLSNTDEIIQHHENKLAVPQVLSQKGIGFLNSIIHTCKQKNIQLILIYSPEYKDEIVNITSNAHEIFDTVSRVAQRNQIPFFRNDTIPMCTEASYFRNSGHLNKKGAQVYSAILANQLYQIIQPDKKLQ